MINVSQYIGTKESLFRLSGSGRTQPPNKADTIPANYVVEMLIIPSNINNWEVSGCD